eukprot:UN24149
MAPTKLYGDSGFLRAYILSFLLSAVCGWYMLGVVENYKDGANTPVTLMKRRKTKLQDMGTWNLTFEVEVSLNFYLDESYVPGDLADYEFTATGPKNASGRGNLVTRIELEKLPTRIENPVYAIQTVTGQVNFDTIEPNCDYHRLPDICYAALYFQLTWNQRALDRFKELREELGFSYPGNLADPIMSAHLRVRNPS